MYLYKKHYVKNNEWNSNGFKVTVERNGKPYKDINYDRVTYIEENVAYWRKFNALHNWFIQLSGREDDCSPIYVSKEALESLLNTLEEVLNVLDNSEVVLNSETYMSGEIYTYKVYKCADKIEELLPPTEGFFFGSTDIDEYYYNQVRNTIVIIKNELANSHNAEFYYQASW